MTSDSQPPTSASDAASPDVVLVPVTASVAQAGARGPSNAQYFLGLFVLWQLFFLFASNFIGLIQDVQNNPKYVPKDWKRNINGALPGLLDKKDRINDLLVAIDGNIDRWAYLTCQPQAWKLFAPNVGKDATFVAVELRWDETDTPAPGKAGQKTMPYAPELLLSENEPRDPAHFFRLGKFRLRKYESSLDVSLTLQAGDDVEETAAEWERQIKERLSNRWDNIHAYFLYRYREWKKGHPDRPMPRQFILHVRRYDIPRPHDFSTSWYRADSLPMARWKPEAPGTSSYYQMERYVPSVLDVLCSADPTLREAGAPEVLALLGYWPRPAQPLALALIGVQHRVFTPGHFVVLD